MSDTEDDRRNNYDEENEDQIEMQVTKNISTIFRKAKEDIEIAMESKDDQKQKIIDILSGIQIPYLNKTCPNYFYDILETLRKKKYLDLFVPLVRIKNSNKLLYIIKEAYLKELNILSGVKDEKSSLHMIKFIVGNFVYQLNKRDQKKLEHFLFEKNKINPKYTDEIITMLNKTKNIFTMYICGLCLNIKNENKKKFEEIFTSFIDEKIIDEENKENNIAKLRVLSKFLNNISPELFVDKIISNCGRLLSRSSKNYEFFSTVFIGADKIKYNDDNIKNLLFKEYVSFFFPTSNPSPNRTIQINQSFKNIAENCNLSLLLEEILNMNLDDNELYIYSYNFICRIFKIYGTNKEINTKYPLNEQLLIKSLLYVLENFDKIYHDNQKEFINYFFQTFLSSLYCIPKIKIDQNKQKENISKLGSLIKDLISNNTYSNYHNYFYLIPAVTMEQFDYIYEDDILDKFYSLLEDNYNAEITEENSANILPLTTCSLNLSVKDNDFKSKSQDKLNKVFTNMITSNLFINNYNKLSHIESICLYLICQFLAKGQSSFTEDEVNHTNFLKLLSKSLFKGKTSNNELYVFNQLVLTLIDNKEVCIQILNLLFNFVLYLNKEKPINSISFRRVAIFLDKFTEKYFVPKFIDELDNNTFLQLIILIHIPNMHLDININNHKSHRKNMFIQKFYKEENKKNLMVSNIEKNIVDTICPFVFSRYGLFNKSNMIIVNSCYELIKKIFQETKVSNLLLQNSFGLLKYEKFKEVNDKLDHYKKNIDYILKYDLIELVNKIKKTENETINSYDIQLYKDEENKEEKKDNKEEDEKDEEKEEVKEEVKKNYNKKGKNKNKNRQNENKKEKKETQKKKEEIKINEEEYKSYVFIYCYKLCNHLIFMLKRLKPIFNHLNIFEYYNSKENIKYVILQIWPLLKIEFYSSFIKRCFLDYFRDNELSKRFNLEFSEIMFLETINDDKQFSDNYKENQILISKLNRKLIEIFKDKDTEKGKTYMNNLFYYYDFVIIRLLFYIILNKGVLMDDVIESVENLISILQNLNSLNYEDISVLLIPLLKSNYYGENMKVLLELYFKNASEKSFIDLCKELLNYEYISKYSFMNSMINQNMSCIKNYQFIHYKIFILSYEENEILNNLAKQIWEKFELNLDDKFMENDDFKLATQEHKATDMVNRAIREYVHRYPKKFNDILQHLLNFYEEEIGKINEERDKIEDNEEENNEDDDENSESYKYKKIHDPMIRKYLFHFINETLDLMNSNKKKELLDFFMKISDEEYSQDMFDEMNNSIFNLINSIPENDIITKTLTSIKEQILDISEKNKEEINYNNLKIIMMMLNSVLVRIFHDKTFTKERETLFDALLELSHHIDNKDVFILLSKNIEYLSADIEEKSSKVFDELLQKLSNTKKKLYDFGDIYALSGLIKCFGISSYKEKKIDEIIKKNMEKKSSIEDKQNAMYTIKIFFETMKKLYEPYFVEIFAEISTMISNREKKVRETAQECFKGMMKELSGYGVDKIMPNLIKDLHTMNTKGKIANIEILGQFAYCAPKQLSIYIPKIIKEIMKVLTDPQKNVQETASNVLNDIASTIKNPEIVDNADILIKAIQNPFDSSKNALEMMMETEFYHYLDPPSLALIIPILDYNLKTQNDELKRMSAHILGSIQYLIQDQNDLIQYMDIIVPDLKIAIFDSDPNCRNEISKAVGALTKSLGPRYLTEMMKWLEGFLENESDTVQRSGAAQGYAEIIVSFEESYIDKHLMRIINRIQEGDHIKKEGYLSVFVFLPGCLGDKFEKYFELIFPLIIEGFSDEHENVRNVSNKIFEICIKIFARKNTTQLVEPLLERLFSENWRIRNSSIALIKTLISSLGKEFSKENSDYFKKELRDQILTYTFILKSDTCGNTETLANIIWRDYVDNIPKYLSKILMNIYKQLMKLINDERNEETYNIAKLNVGLLATKFSDKFFNELIPIIRETLIQEKNNEYTTDASFTIISVAVKEISERLLTSNRNTILKIMYENIFTEFSSIRIQIAEIVYLMSIRLNDHNMNRNLVNNVMKQVRGKQANIQKGSLEIVANLTEISKGEVIRYVIAEIFKKPYEEGFLELGNMISTDIVSSIDDQNEAKTLFSSLYETFIDIPSTSMRTIASITSKLDEEYLELFVKLLEKIYKKIKSDEIKESKEQKKGKECIEFYFSELISSFCSKSEQSLETIYDNLIEIIFNLLNYDNDQLIKNVGSILKTLVEKTDKSPDIDIIVTTLLNSMDNLYENIKVDVENNEEKYIEVVSKKITLIMEHLLFTIQNELLYGNNKILACRLINDIIFYCPKKNLKPYIMKLVGPMIRILGEKIPPETKEKLMENAKNLILKVKEDIKGISPQLQSVFLKTLNDSTNLFKPEHHQVKAGENIILLLKYYPRIDVTANDIFKSIQNKLDQKSGISALLEMEILSDVIRFYGTSLKPDTITKQFNTVKMWQETHSEINYDIMFILLTSYTPFLNKEVIDDLEFEENTSEDLFKILCSFNGKKEDYDKNISFFIEKIKTSRLDRVIHYLIPIGKILSKYNYYKQLNPKEIEKLIKLYNGCIVDLFSNHIKLKPTNDKLDGMICLFLINLGYIEDYETNKIFCKNIFHFLLKLMGLSKVNFQILITLFSLIVLKKPDNSPNKDDVLEAVRKISDDEKDLEIVETFLKKIYYINDK